MLTIVNHNKVIGLRQDLDAFRTYMKAHANSLNLSQQEQQNFVKKEVQAWLRLKLRECQTVQEQDFLKHHLR